MVRFAVENYYGWLLTFTYITVFSSAYGLMLLASKTMLLKHQTFYQS